MPRLPSSVHSEFGLFGFGVQGLSVQAVSGRVLGVGVVGICISDTVDVLFAAAGTEYVTASGDEGLC